MILQGDCIERMREMDLNSIDALVTDPPYGMSLATNYKTRKRGRLTESNDNRRSRVKA